MPSTITPSVSWHNTSLQQINGEATDVSIEAAVTGRDALDNIAYLTGKNTNDAVRRLGYVATVLALRNLNTPEDVSPQIRDNDFLYVTSLQASFRYDFASVATADNYSVIEPTSSVGRYLRVGNLPKSTSMEWTVAGTDFFGLFDPSNLPTFTYTDGTLLSNANDATTVSARIPGFAPGDVLSSAVVTCVSGGTPSNAVVTVYAIDPGTSNTMTTLGTATLTQPLSAQTTISFGTPYTFVKGDTVQVVVDFGGGTGNWTIKNATIVGTRAYITQ